jgi:hypothetical protein
MSIGSGLFGNLIGSIDKKLANTPLGRDWVKATDTGYGVLGTGQQVTSEGLGDLRGLQSDYQGLLKNPLGTVGAGIFSRARGQLGDAFTRDVNAGGARRAQLAAQSGGSLTPEQLAALDAQDRRDAGANLFAGSRDLSQAEAKMTLDQTNMLYDRLDAIAKTITGVGTTTTGQGLQTILAGLTGRTGYNKAVVSNVLGPWGHG